VGEGRKTPGKGFDRGEHSPQFKNWDRKKMEKTSWTARKKPVEKISGNPTGKLLKFCKEVRKGGGRNSRERGPLRIEEGDDRRKVIGGACRRRIKQGKAA